MLKLPSRILKAPSYFFSGQIKALKTRIKTVKNISKITKAMKMVSQAKMRAELRRLLAGQDFGIHTPSKIFEQDYNVSKKWQDSKKGTTLLLPVTTDRGLCGSINQNLIKDIREMVKEDRESYKVFCIGLKGQ